jgi:hypothetical protein
MCCVVVHGIKSSARKGNLDCTWNEYYGMHIIISVCVWGVGGGCGNRSVLQLEIVPNIMPSVQKCVSPGGPENEVYYQV